MSPFSIYLRELRGARKMSQKDAALLLGTEQSYLCALEKSKLGPPNEAFIQSLKLKFKLTEIELLKLGLELQRSQRTIKLPVNADINEYEIMNKFREKIGKLKPQQFELLKLALDLQV